VKGECPRPLDDRVFSGVLWLHQVESAQAENVILARGGRAVRDGPPYRLIQSVVLSFALPGRFQFRINRAVRALAPSC
jgi:hypothetical protein